MDRPFISRTLSYDGSDGEPMELGNDELMNRIEPLVILGDAGMGKTAMLERLSTADGARFVTARKLLREPDPRLLVGDAGCLPAASRCGLAGRAGGGCVTARLISWRART